MTNILPGISIVICTYNGKKNLEKTLSHIALQKGIESIAVELVVVDNASTDGTFEFVKKEWETLNCSISLFLLKEPRVGKGNASRLAFSHCRFSYILVCDDDNWLCDTYVRQAYDIMAANSNIGVLGGKGEAVFEDEKPAWFDKYQSVFAVGQQYNTSGDVTDKIENIWGAGMVFRKEVWDKLLEMNYHFFLNEQRDKKGNWGGDDVELCMMIVNLGYKMWVENNMTYKHFMPKQRMAAKYLRSRYYGLGRSRLYLQAYIFCRSHDKMPGSHLKYPLWLDKWIHMMKLYLSELPKHLLSSSERVDEEALKFIALKGELYELWKLKKRYNEVYTSIFEFKRKIAVLNSKA